MRKNKEKRFKKWLKWVYLGCSVILFTTIFICLTVVNVGAKVYYNVEATPRALLYEEDLNDFLIETRIGDEEIYVNYKISYDNGEEETGSVLYVYYSWVGGDLQYVSIKTGNSAFSPIVQYWETAPGSMGRLFYNGQQLSDTGVSTAQDFTIFMSVDTDNLRQNNLFLFFFFEDVYYQNGYEDGDTHGYRVGYGVGFQEGKADGRADGIGYVISHPHEYNLYTANEYEAVRDEAYLIGVDDGIDTVIDSPHEYNLYTTADLDEAIANAIHETENNLTGFVWRILEAIQGFFNIQLGPVTLGAIILIPFSISIVWFIIKQFRGGN